MKLLILKIMILVVILIMTTHYPWCDDDLCELIKRDYYKNIELIEKPIEHMHAIHVYEGEKRINKLCVSSHEHETGIGEGKCPYGLGNRYLGQEPENPFQHIPKGVSACFTHGFQSLHYPFDHPIGC